LKRIAILIATTGGPVLVDRITPEPAPQSMVCLRRQSDVLPISPDYDDFVRPGSGVIMREFGPYAEGAFRLDVSDPIGSGLSWQLGFFAAHAIFKSNVAELSNLENADLIVWLTGKVNYDLHIESVDHIFEKVDASALMLATYIGKGTPIIFGASPENAKFLEDKRPPKGIRVAALQTTHDLLHVLDLTPKAAPEVQPYRSGSSFWVMAGLAVLAVIALFVFTNAAKKQDPVAPIADQIDDSDLKLNLTSDRGKEPIYHFGDDLTLIVSLSKKAWLYCFYKQVDGAILQVYPNPQMNDAQKGKPLLKEIRHVLSGANNTPFVIRLGPPAGKEEVICFASDKDIRALLPAELRGNSSDPLPEKIAKSLEKSFLFLKNVYVSIDHIEITLTP
jgi:hypothetical protein